MPHLDFGTFAGQLFWLAICFVTLYIVVARNVLPKIGGVLESRGKNIADNLQTAEDLKNQAELLEIKYQKALHESAERARNLIDESTEKAEEKLESKRRELAAKLDEKMKKAEKEIINIQKDSEDAVEKISAEIAKQIANKIAV